MTPDNPDGGLLGGFTGSMSCIFDPVVVGQPQRFYRVALTNCVP